MATKATQAKTTEVETAKPGGALQTYDYGQDAGAGFENVGKDDLVIPFLKVLQGLSPEVQDVSEGGVEGAKPGMLYNSVTQELTPGKDGVVLVPACTQHVFIEFVPRAKGGGFVGVHQPESDVVVNAKERSEEFGKYKTPEGNELIETFSIFAIVADESGEEAGSMVVIPFSSTKIGAYKSLISKLHMFQLKAPNGAKVKPPMFAHRVKMVTIKDSNPKGEFFNVSFSPAIGATAGDSLLPPGHPLMEAAKQLKELAGTGKAKADYSKAASAAAAGESDADIPF